MELVGSKLFTKLRIYFRSPKTTKKNSSPTANNKQIHKNQLLQQFINPLLTQDSKSNSSNNSNSALNSAIPESKTFNPPPSSNQNISVQKSDSQNLNTNSITVEKLEPSINPDQIMEQARLLTKQTQEWIQSAREDQVSAIQTLLGTITHSNDPITQKNALQVLLEQTQKMNKDEEMNND